MNVEIKFPSYDAQQRTYVTWRPVEVKLKLLAPPAGVAQVALTVSAKSLVGGGKLRFATTLTHLGTPTLNLNLPASGAPVSVWVGGDSQAPSASSKYGDVTMEVRATAGNQLLGSQPTMVRVRKNADTLSTAERDRFLSALATLNGAGAGPYKSFREMHVDGAPDREAHGGPGFLPWHRAYLLDFERELQNINAEVTLPYWRFDKAAPNLFSRAFIGLPNSARQVQFNAGHPLLGWVAVSGQGIERGTGVGPGTVPNLFSEGRTIQPGGVLHPNYASFRNMQGNPHGAAHTSNLSGWIYWPGTAPQDPLFFLLHCNVDRLWAKWQWAAKIHDPNDPKAFTPAAGFPAGHRPNDPLWPWCGPLAAPRPLNAPGGPLASSPMTAAPGPSPKNSDMIDYLGTVSPNHQAFAYDDVPFQK